VIDEYKRHVDRAIAVLGRRSKRNPVLLSDDFVRKQTFFDLVRERLAQDDLPPRLFGHQIIDITEDQLLGKMQHIESFKNWISVIDPNDVHNRKIFFLHDIHRFLGVELPDEILRELHLRARGFGNLAYVASSTLENYRKYIVEPRVTIDRAVFSQLWFD